MKGLLFKDHLAQAIYRGRKTQTRRVVTHVETGEPVHTDQRPYNKSCPYGEPGSLFYVKEGFMITPHKDASFGQAMRGSYITVTYRADGSERHFKNDASFSGPGLHVSAIKHDVNIYHYGRWCSPLHMPEWAARSVCEVTDVRVERLNEISEDDARAEGIVDGGCLQCGEPEPCGCPNPKPCAMDSFVGLWNSIQGPGAWDANPWVWVVTFRNVEEQ